MRHHSVNSAHDGFVFAYEISDTHFSLKLFRLIPLGRVRLDDMRYIRQRSSSDLQDFFSDLLLRPFKSWYWPHTLIQNGGLRSTPYIIRTRKNRNIFVRLKVGYHYRLRAAMGEARGALQDVDLQAHPPPPMSFRQKDIPPQNKPGSEGGTPPASS